MSSSDVRRTPTAGRVRPVAHFTPRRGWINDPYGVRWDGSRYHMCYQAVPDQTVWSPECAWGHAVSDDLVSWEERGVALVPQAHEVGCWSGCVVDDAAGVPVAFYTRVQLADLELGAIAVARFERSRLVSGPRDVVIAGPPEGLAVTAFRDPYVWRDAAGWSMIVGAGTADGAGAVLHYSSPDLERWRYVGALCRGRVGPDCAGTRQVWECPQMVKVDEAWVLIVSVGVDGRAGPVAAAVGSYDGVRFVPSGWQRPAFGTAPYATSVFRDRDGRPCMISWLREDPQRKAPTSAWAGAESLVSELAIDGAGRVTAAPHPELARSMAFAHRAPVTAPLVYDLVGVTPARATHLTAAPDGPAEIELRHSHQRLVRVTRSSAGDALLVDRTGCAIEVIPCPGPPATIELFVDADILELFSGGVYGAWRLGP